MLSKFQWRKIADLQSDELQKSKALNFNQSKNFLPTESSARKIPLLIFFAVSYHLLYVQHRIIIVIWSQVTQKKNNQMEATLNWTLLFLWINDI
jgi:hypothetical protein